MPAPLDLTGRRFGRLVALRQAVPRSCGTREWVCWCDCGIVEPFPTSRLTATDEKRRVTACRTCSGSRPRPTVDHQCAVCGTAFRGDPIARFCSIECSRARRRGRDAGVDHLPAPRTACEICGTSFPAERGRKACSPECLRERRRRKALDAWRRRVARDPGIARKMAQRRRERAETDPEHAARLAAWNQTKYARHRERMAADPEYAALHHERARKYHAEHAETIQARRRARLQALPEADLAELAERMRRYSRRHARKRRADPILAARDREVRHEWQRRQNAGLFTLQVAQLLAEASARLDDPARVKPCAECGQPVVGRRSCARTCSDACARIRQRRHVVAARRQARKLPADRVCPICSAPIDPETARIACSKACATERKRRQRPSYKEHRP